MPPSADRAQVGLVWQEAVIEALDRLSPRVVRVVLRPTHWIRPMAGQHLDLRLTAEDGYRAQRSYSLLSPPDREGVYELGIERLDEGEVSPWFHEAAEAGESVEVLGPVGGHFVWQATDARPTLLVGSGSGVVPLLSMAAHRAAQPKAAPMVLQVAARTVGDVLLWSEMQAWEAQDAGFQSRLALSQATRVDRPQDHAGRLRESDLAAALQRLGDGAAQSAQVFVCGRNDFVENAVGMLRALRVPDSAIRTERFGG